MSRESDLTQLWLKWVESELSQVSKFGFWVESELSQVSKFGIWVESELSHLDCHMSQNRVSPKKMSRAQPCYVGIPTYKISMLGTAQDLKLDSPRLSSARVRLNLAQSSAIESGDLTRIVTWGSTRLGSKLRSTWFENLIGTAHLCSARLRSVRASTRYTIWLGSRLH